MNYFKSKYALTIIIVLLFSTFLPTFAYAAPQANSEKDWQYTNGNSWAWTYSPETQINKGNIRDLEVKWIYPLDTKNVPAALRSTLIGEGSATPPIVAGGKVFVTTQYLRTYAIDAETGKGLWAHDYALNVTEIEARLPMLLPANAGFLGSLNNHLHGIRYWDSGKAVVINGMACDFYGINATSGKKSFWVKDLCKDVPGNLYKYRQGTANTDGIATYEKGKQFIYVLPGVMHSWTFKGDARNVMMGIDMNTQQIIWRIYNYPPQDKPTKNWALQECSIGFFQATPCSEVAAKALGNLEWDWAQPDQPPNIYGGVTANWGSTPVVDEDTGILYTQTGNQGPYTYVGTTPGPRLYGSTIMAIDMNQGKRIWWLQPFPRDPYDYDCNWDGILADIPNVGKVYMKGCKEGRLYVMDAKTGTPLYVKDIINEQFQWGQITKAGTLEPTKGGNKYHLNDPLNHYDMREMLSPDNSTYCGRPCELYPHFMNGIFATDMSYDPQTRTLFHYAAALQATLIDSISPEKLPDQGSMSIARNYPITNTTIVARDVATGNVKWTWFYELGQQRAHMVVTSDMVFAGFTDGYMRFFDKDKGTLLREVNLGSSLTIGPSTAQDSKGNQKIFTLVTRTQNPGYVLALGLSDRASQAPSSTVTTTTTASTTVTSTTTTTSAITSTVVSTSISTTTSAITSTITSTEAPSTTTITSEVTGTNGLPAEITYAAIAVAVMAVVATAVLIMKRQ
ncbi:MAG: hypothetical protein M1503_08400 [Thaumarchaeota archaeon]|nr:hypothetical protein [Nitrososphaerota archaeon]